MQGTLCWREQCLIHGAYAFQLKLRDLTRLWRQDMCLRDGILARLERWLGLMDVPLLNPLKVAAGSVNQGPDPNISEHEIRSKGLGTPWLAGRGFSLPLAISIQIQGILDLKLHVRGREILGMSEP